MIVVSNSSVLIALAMIGELDLLRAKFGDVHVPEAVWREVVEEGKGLPGANEVSRANWINRHAVSGRALADEIGARLDEGEAEAIVLAKELEASHVLLDEKAGRRQARAMGLVTVGTLGVLVLGKKSGIVRNLRQAIERLVVTGRFRLSQSVIEAALREAGEA